jgi:hypothetical protein
MLGNVWAPETLRTLSWIWLRSRSRRSGRTNLPSGLAAFAARRFERCRMVVENGLQIMRRKSTRAPGGLTMRSQMGIGAPA